MRNGTDSHVLPLHKDVARMSEWELYQHIQYLKREVARRAAEREGTDLTRLTEDARRTLAEIAIHDAKEIARLVPVEAELRAILCM